MAPKGDPRSKGVLTMPYLDPEAFYRMDTQPNEQAYINSVPPRPISIPVPKTLTIFSVLGIIFFVLSIIFVFSVMAVVLFRYFLVSLQWR